MPSKKDSFISKTLNGFPKTSITASYLVHYMKYKVMSFGVFFKFL